MSSIKDVLARNIEENIAPVIYFHQIDPETAAQEVREYVFTSRPARDNYQGGGIHEQMVRLLTELWVSLTEGRKLPASWISGFFGSGKSSFAKLLGLALDGMVLPDGKTMDLALLERNDTPRVEEFRDAWTRLASEVRSKAVVFDIGTAAKNNESIPHTAYRQVLERLGYSSHDGVAHFEIALEDEGRWDDFLSAYSSQYGKHWEQQKNLGLAPQKFRTIYKGLFPEQDELMEISTYDIRRLTIKKLVDNLVRVMDRRCPGETIFIVVDEVSQYINKDHNKMLDLQSFVSEIGGRAKPGSCPLWLIVTGQEKLEEESSESVLFKLKDRFPEPLRVHLDRSNVREVVERRLLKKKPASALEGFLTPAQVDSLRLYAYECASVTREAVLANYPLLPSHIPLFMDITQSIRNTSARTQSDSGGVRSVLNNIWDLFNRPPVCLKDRPLGTLMTLDMLYDIIGSSVDSDVQLTLHKVFERHPADSLESRIVKAIALLELGGEQRPVTQELLASLLYPALGSPPVLDAVKAAIGTLRGENWIQFHEKSGWSVQNNAAQDWNRQKAEINIPASEIDEQIRSAMIGIIDNIAQPGYRGSRFPLVAYWGLETRLSSKNDPTQAGLCFHWVGNSSRRNNADEWLALSKDDFRRFHWVSGDTGNLETLVRQQRRSDKMHQRYKNQGQLQPMQARLVYAEGAESERLLGEIRNELRRVWMEGRFYHNGSVVDPTQGGGGFDIVLKREVEARLPLVYHKFEQGQVDVKDGDFKQLLEKDCAGLSMVFFEREGGLGIATRDGNRIVFTCPGPVPRAVMECIEEKGFWTGESLIAKFAGPPYGYSRLVIKSAVLGLLRDERIIVRGENNSEISSVMDPGAKNTFELDREFNKAEIERKQGDGGVSGRDRTEIRQFFEESLKLENVENSSDVLADLCFKHFIRLKDRVKEVRGRLASLRIELPREVEDFDRQLSECVCDRHVDKALHRVKANLQGLREGYPRLKDIIDTLTTSTEEALRAFRDSLDIRAKQLGEVERAVPIQANLDELKAHLGGASPWRGYADLRPAAEAIDLAYVSTRQELLAAQAAALEEAEDEIKQRPEFIDLDVDQQYAIQKPLREARIDTGADAVQPSLLVLKQASQRILEARSRAQAALDRIVNERAGDQGGGSSPIYPVKIGLRDKVVSSEAELDRQLGTLREKCLAQLKSGARVRFEE